MDVLINVRAPRGDKGPAGEFWECYGRLDGFRELGILTVDLLTGAWWGEVERREPSLGTTT